MKTAKAHFETFDEPYRSKAIDNTGDLLIDFPIKSRLTALIAAFSWENSDEGYDYWYDFYNTIAPKDERL